jgi:hypothetical protein
MTFYILVLLGSACILLGFSNRRIQKQYGLPEGFAAAEPVPVPESIDTAELKSRVEQLEKLVFQNLVIREEEKAETAAEAEEPAVHEEAAAHEEAQRQPMPDSVRAVLDYESQGLSLHEIANITRMNKGEVLLLKNLSKHYSR